MARKQASLISNLILLTALLSVPSVFGAEEATVSVASAKHEQFERDVDRVALSTQEKAIAKLNSLLKKYRNKRQEPILLQKLADLQQENASILFRIAHGNAHRGNKALNLSLFNRTMAQSIETLNVLLAKYPNYEEAAHAYFMRGHGYEEMDKKDSAKKDYLYLVHHFKEADECIPAYMSLADFAIEANDHPTAISYLKEVEKHPEDPHYPFALYKLAWSHYNLKNYPAAISFSERHVAYYNDPRRQSTSEQALRENTLLDITVFYFDGYEAGLSQYGLKDALGYFKHLESGKPLGKMLLRFAKLIRSHSREADLMYWRDQVLANESDRPEALDVLITTYEYQHERRLYKEVIDSALAIAKLYQSHPKYESFPKAQKLLLDTAEGLQTLVVKNKGASDVQTYSQTLATIYDTFTRIVADSDPRIPRVHYNLAETLFTIQDYAGATFHYRWIVEHTPWDLKRSPASTAEQAKKDTFDVPSASLKAIASRYEILRKKDLIPKELAARPLSDNTDKKLDPQLSEWIAWLDFHVRKTDKETETFVFEANRALYASGHVQDALARFGQFARKHPDSHYAIPSASLILDTYIASSDWDKTLDLANDFQDVKEWKSTEFAKRLFAAAADASYKKIEILYRSKDYPGSMKAADRFLKRYSASTRLPDCLILAGNAATQNGEKPRAVEYFTRLIKEAGQSEGVASALLARAGIEEEAYQFADASRDYRAYLSLPPALMKGQDEGKLAAFRKKSLMLSWLTGDRAELKSALETGSICKTGSEASMDCEQFFALAQFPAPTDTGDIDEKSAEAAFDHARETKGGRQAIWSALALAGSKHFGFRDRHLMIRTLASSWGDLDPVIQFSLVPQLSVWVPKAFNRNRLGMNETAPLRANEKYIARRIEVIKEMETDAEKIMVLPWARIRAQVLNEIAGLYLDLSHGLTELTPPKDLSASDLAAYEETIRKLVVPFEEKGQDVRAKAFEIASRFAIEDDSFHAIADPFFTENPSQAKTLKLADHLDNPPEISLAFLDDLDSDGKWGKVAKLLKKHEEPDSSSEPALRLKLLWARALDRQNWQQATFFAHELENRKLATGPSLGVIKAMTLIAAGARGEGLTELEEGRKAWLDPEAKTKVTMALVQYHLRACDKDKTQSLLKEIPAEGLNKKQASLVAMASAWSGKKR